MNFATTDAMALYRLRWRLEFHFKRLKSLSGLAPPRADEHSARPQVLAHLLISLLLEPLVDELKDSPRLAEAARPGAALGTCCSNSCLLVASNHSARPQSPVCTDPRPAPADIITSPLRKRRYKTMIQLV